MLSWVIVESGVEQWFPHRWRNSEYSGEFSGALLEKIKRLREALVWSVRRGSVLPSCYLCSFSTPKSIGICM